MRLFLPRYTLATGVIVSVSLITGCAPSAARQEEPTPLSHVTITMRGLEMRTTTDRETIGEVLRDNHIDIYPEDLVAPDLTEPIRDGQTITIDPAAQVTIINFYGEEHDIRTRSKTVGSLIREIGYEPAENEIIRPHTDTLLVDSLIINLIRTTEDAIETDVAIPYRTKYVRDDSKDFTYRIIQQEGKNGVKKKTIQTIYENDVLIDRVTVSEVIVEEPITEIILIGTQTPPGGTVLGIVRASYYGSGFQGRRTASGETFDHNALTAAHRTLPFGAQVKVTNPATNESVIVRITDRGPYVDDRDIDLSEAAFGQISHLGAGVITVNLEMVNEKQSL